MQKALQSLQRHIADDRVHARHPGPYRHQQLLAAEPARLAAQRQAMVNDWRVNHLGVDTMTARSLLALVLFWRQTAALHIAQLLQAAEQARHEAGHQAARRSPPPATRRMMASAFQN